MKRKEKILKVGIAGYGIVGKRRRYFIDLHPNMHTVAVCDQKFTKSGVFSDGVNYFMDYKNLLKHPIDILFVSLPNYLAAEVTKAALKRGIHVFCEKPPGRNVQDIKSVIAVEKRHPGILLKYGFNHRYHDSVCEALKIIQSGELGEIVNLRGVYGKSKVMTIGGEWRAVRKLSGGGILLDQGIHMVDLMRLFCGKFEKVKSFVSNDYWKHDVEDNVFAIMQDTKGRVAMLHSSATQWQHRFALHVTLSDGSLELRGILTGSKSYGEEKLAIVRRVDSSVGTLNEEVVSYLDDNSWGDEVNEFAEAIISGSKIKFGGSEDALETMKLVYRIYYADPKWRKKYSICNPDRKQYKK